MIGSFVSARSDSSPVIRALRPAQSSSYGFLGRERIFVAPIIAQHRTGRLQKSHGALWFITKALCRGGLNGRARRLFLLAVSFFSPSLFLFRNMPRAGRVTGRSAGMMNLASPRIVRRAIVSRGSVSAADACVRAHTGDRASERASQARKRQMSKARK